MSSEVDANSAVVLRLVICAYVNISNGVSSHKVCSCHAPIIVTRQCNWLDSESQGVILQAS